MVCKEDISSGRWRGKKMSEESLNVVVVEYVNNSCEMLNFCSALNRFLKSARQNHLEIERVVQQCEIETDPAGGNRYARISDKLKSLKADAHHYESADNLLQMIQSLQAKNQQLYQKLKLEYEKQGSKEKSARAWRKAVNMIFITTVVFQCVTGAALAVGGSPPAAMAIGITIAPTIAVHHWAHALISQYERGLEDDLVKLRTMQHASVFAIKELGDVQFLIDKVVNEIDSFLFSPNLSSANEGQVETAVNNIKTKLVLFLNKIEDLVRKGEDCSSEIMSSRDKVVSSMKAA